MSKKIWRGAFATLTAGALALTLAPSAFAALDDPDGNPIIAPPAETIMSANVYRIADVDRIATSIEASQSRTDWGNIRSTTALEWSCSEDSYWLHGEPATSPWELGEYFFPVTIGGLVRCDVVAGDTTTRGTMDIIVARADEYSDALAAAPLADVLDAPILLSRSDYLRDDVRAEIARLAALAGDRGRVRVHLLGGTNALSHVVESGNALVDGIDDIPGVDRTIRYQGIDRYETAANIATRTVNTYGLESGADGNDVNVYLTTGTNFPDALAAGAAAANNDGVVLLTNGANLDRRDFTEDFLTDLENWVIDERWDINTSEIFAVGGPSAQAAEDYDIRLAPDGAYVGRDRYETAVITAEKTFKPGQDVDYYALVSGETFPDALVASGYIANLDGPLLLTRATSLTPVTAEYIEENVNNGDSVITFGGPDSLRVAVTNQVKALLAAKFAIDPEIA